MTMLRSAAKLMNTTIAATATDKGDTTVDKGATVPDEYKHVYKVIISGKEIVYDFPEIITTWSGIVFGILSGGKGSFERRQSIRDTWCLKQNCLFLVAGSYEDIKQEYQDKQDILWLDTTENYFRITYKTHVFMHVAHENIDKLTYAFKTDDDSYIFTDRLKNELSLTTPKYWGRLAHKIKPMRNKDSYYYTTISVYPNEYYPDFCRGAGYALSKFFLKCAVTKLQNAIFMPWEDVATGILANMCKVSVSDAGERLVGFSRKTPVTKQLIVKHYVKTAKNMMHIHSQHETNTN